jgi:hypothetical protein
MLRAEVDCVVLLTGGMQCSERFSRVLLDGAMLRAEVLLHRSTHHLQVIFR